MRYKTTAEILAMTPEELRIEITFLEGAIREETERRRNGKEARLVLGMTWAETIDHGYALVLAEERLTPLEQLKPNSTYNRRIREMTVDELLAATDLPERWEFYYTYNARLVGIPVTDDLLGERILREGSAKGVLYEKSDKYPPR